MDRRLEGHLAIDYIMTAASGPIIATWDGTTEHVALIAQKDDEHMHVGFITRAGAIALFQGLAADTHNPAMADELRGYATELAAGPTDKVQGIIHGWGGCTLVSIEPEDLRRAPLIGAAPVFVDFGNLIETASTQHGASALLAEARAGLEIPAADLDHLAELLLDRWDDIGAIAVAIAKASQAIAPQLGTPGGQRAHEILNALTQATSDRGAQGRGQNARGGSA